MMTTLFSETTMINSEQNAAGISVVTEHAPHRPDPDRHTSEQILKMITGGWVTQILHAAAATSLADHLHRAPMTAAAFAKAEGLDEAATSRFLNACTSLELTRRGLDGVFIGTSLLDRLRSDHPATLRSFAIMIAARMHWAPWERFVDAVRAGRSQAEQALGADAFTYLSQSPEDERLFSEAMSNFTQIVAKEVARALDTTGASEICDIGGAEGALLMAILAQNASARGVIFDRPSVAALAAAAVVSNGLEDRISIVGGDFFHDVPESDVYLLKHILHDWNDEECLRILNNCHRRLRSGGRIAIIELVLADGGDPVLAPLMDLNMLVMTTGRERSFAEYAALLKAAGFADARLVRLDAPHAMVEASKL